METEPASAVDRVPPDFTQSQDGSLGLDYDGRRFRPVTADDQAPAAHYHQAADLLWADFSGGHVRRGTLVGTCKDDGVLDFGYSMVTDGGDVITGRCHSIPELLSDGRIRLTEHWERFPPHASSGVSYLEEVAPHGNGAGPVTSAR
jgi:hypothetical protein